MPATSYDLLILGSGSTAFAAAIRAAEVGKHAVMVETRTIGGTCVNRGCLPSKNLIAAAQIVHDAAHPRFPGITSARLELNFADLIAQKDALIHDYRTQHYDQVLDQTADRAPIDLVSGHARLIDAHTALVTLPDGTTQTLRGEQILIATGSHPAVPALPGLGDTPYLTSDLLTSGEVEELHTLPPSLIILGGGYIAVELGQLFARLGSQVTLLVRSTLLRGYEPEIGSALTDLLRAEGLRILTEAQVQSITGDEQQIEVTFTADGHPQTIRAAKLIIATGRTPNTRELGLEAVGVALDAHGAVQVNEFLQTSIPHIWAAGDVIGQETASQMATPVGAHDGGIVASNAFSGTRQKVNHRIIPRAIFTDPQVGVVGLTDEEANAQGIECQCNTIPISAVPRAGAVRDTRGVIKMVLERPTQRVVGVSMLGRDAGEVIHEAAMALRFGATIDDFIDMIHVYPTMAEALKIVAISFRKDYTKLSCCAG
jgi:mercuric reductase